MIQKLDCTIPEPVADLRFSGVARSDAVIVELVDGRLQDISQLSLQELYQLQWEQETAFAERIKQSKKGSAARTATINQAYKTVCQILSCASRVDGATDFVMGMDQRYTRFVLDRLRVLEADGIAGGLFELGFGSGVLLEAAAASGFRVGGLEVADQLFHTAKRKIPEHFHENLCLGNFLDNEEVNSLQAQFSLVYWNDVFEHIPVDEIEEYLGKIHDLLAPGGELITITPNWHMRPMDVTSSHLPPRSTSIGFHLKEYTLREVLCLLKSVGFKSIKTPLFVGKRQIYRPDWWDTTRLKRLVEPALEWLPYSLAVQCCRRLGFCVTIATK